MNNINISKEYIDNFRKTYPSIPSSMVEYMAKIKFMREFYEKKKIDELRSICESKGIDIKTKSGRFKNSKDLIDNLILHIQDQKDYLRSQRISSKCSSINFEKYNLDTLKRLCDEKNIKYSSNTTKNEIILKLEKLLAGF